MDINFPKDLKDLPVSRSILRGDIRLDENMALVAHTGSGKTMGIPPGVALTQGKKVLLRQPTRQTCKSTYLGLKHFWGDQLKIGMHTSEEDHGSLDECDIMVVTDGVMKNWLKEPKYDMCVIFDEYHSQLPVTEVEAGIVKTYLAGGANFQIILLSATIDPANIVEYFETLNPNPVSHQEITHICQTMNEKGEKVNTLRQNQWLKVRYSEGVAYEIENKFEVFKMDTPKNPGSVFKFCQRLIDEKKRGLVFACTRNEIQDLCTDVRTHFNRLPAEFAHADISIEHIIKFVKDNEPCIVFATVALATSITLPFDEVLIIDKGIDSIWENGIEKQITNIPIDDNGVLQRRGRVGRVKPGICTLASKFRTNSNWDDIKPTAIKPPLSKVSPDHVVMVCAQYEVDARGIDILSNLPAYDIQKSVNRLKSLNLIYEDEEDKTLKHTILGKKVNALPLDIDIGVMVAQCPDEILPAVIAIASFDKGIFNLFKGKITMIDGTEGKGELLFDHSMVHPRSILLTKANILKEAFKARSEMDETSTLRTWADANGMWGDKLKKVMFKFYQICTRGLRKSEKTMRERLKEFDTNKYANAIIEYLQNLKVFEEITLHYDEYRGDDGWKGDYRGYFCILDGMDIGFLQLNGSYGDEIKCLGSAKLIKTRSGNSIAIWGDTTLTHENHWYQSEDENEENDEEE